MLMGLSSARTSSAYSMPWSEPRPQQPGHQGFMATSRLFRRLLLSQRWDNLVAVPGKGRR